MNKFTVVLFLSVYFFGITYAFSINPTGFNEDGDPAPGRSPGPPIFQENSIFDSLSSKCRFNGTIRNIENEIITLTVTHHLFKTDVLVPGILYQVNIKTEEISPIDFILSSSIDGEPFGTFSTSQDCGTHMYRNRVSSKNHTANWTFEVNEKYKKTNITFQIEYIPNRDPFVYRLSFSFPIIQDCNLELIKEEANVSNRDLLHISTCQLWFPVQNNGGHGLVIELTRLNVPCSRGFVHFTGSNMTQVQNTLVYSRMHKPSHLCGKLEELPEVDRMVYFPGSSTLIRPTMRIEGEPTFSIIYHLVDYCYNVTFLTKNGSFDLKPQKDLQCTIQIHLPYGNRVALKLWIGDSKAADSLETSLNFQDFKNGQEECHGLLTQLQDGTASWAHCTKPGTSQRQIEIVSKENKLVLKIRIQTLSKFESLGLKMVYRSEPVENIVGMCDFGWVILRQFCVGIIEGVKLPWMQAEMECVRKGGHLVSIRSDRDHHIIDNVLIKSPSYRDRNSYWIGASDRTHEGDFKWSDGYPFSYSNWFPGWAQHNNYNKQPNDDGLSDQDCVEVRRFYPFPTSNARLAKTFMWNDRDCSTPNYFICERLQNNEPLEDTWLPSCNKTVILSRDQPRVSVSSPGFPRQYPDNANCDIDIIVSPGFRIILDFEELVLEDEPYCSYDYLQILENSWNETISHSNSTSSRRLCGDWSSKLKLLRYVSHSSRIKLRFSSDYSHHFGGFKTRVSMENAAFQCADDRFSMFNESCYLIVGYPEVTWNTSQQICQGMKSNLASVLSAEEERFITSSIRRAPEYRTSAIYWLGALSTISNNYSWIDGSPMRYQSWLPGLEPTDNDLIRHAEEITCLSLQWTPTPGLAIPSGLYWKGHRCLAVGGYVCKKQHQIMGAGVNYNQTINGTEGSITSPNFPNNYYQNLDVYIHITGPDKTRIIIKFIHIHIESQLECLYDYIELQSSYKHTKSLLNDKVVLCGDHEKDMDRFNFVSETNEVEMKFHTDYSISDRGFSLIWYAVDVSACPKQTLTAKEGTLITPNYPEFLLAHLDCTITILAPNGKRIWFEFFHEEQIISQDEDFYVELVLGKRSRGHRLFETESLITDGTFISSDEKLVLKMHTGDHPIGAGFRAGYKTTTVVKEAKVITLSNYTSGILLHLNYPDKPPSNVDFTQHFIAPLGRNVLIELHNVKVDCESQSSFIEISDSYADTNGTTWKLCYNNEIDDFLSPSTPIYISSYLNTLHLRQVHGIDGIPLNGSLKLQFDNNYKEKLRNYKDGRVESCFPNPCQNGGKCMVTNSTKHCQCVGYYTGLFCALTKCELDPCAFGTCELTDSSYKCHCKTGYVGIMCDQKRRPCEGNPCESRGTCIEKGDNFQCQCHAWWEGQRCEKRMLHIPYKPLSERMLHEPFWLGLMTVFVVMGVIGLVWCAKRHFPEKIEKLLAEEDSRNRSTVSSLRSSSVREQLASASGVTTTPSQGSGPGRSFFGRLGIRKPSILSLTSPHASGYEAATARTFSLDDLLKPPQRRTPSPKKKRNNSTPTKKNIADKRQILQQLVSPKPNSKKVSLGELIQLSEMKPDEEIKSQIEPKDKFSENAAQTALIDPKLEKKVTFARLLNKVSAEMSSGSEMEMGIMQTNRLGCMFARPASTPPSPSVDTRSPNSMSSNQGSDSFTSSDLAIPSALSTSISDLLINRRYNRCPTDRQKPASADSILAMFRNFSSTSAAIHCSSSLKITPSTTPTASSPQDDIVGDDDSSASPSSFSSGMESPTMQRHNVQGTIEVPVLDAITAHKSSSGGSNFLHPATVLLEIPSTINKCLSPIREMPTPLPSPMPSPALTPLVTRRSHASSSLDDTEMSDDRISIEIPNVSISTDPEEDDLHCPDIAIDIQAEDGLILEEAAALQHSIYKSKNRPPPIGQSQDRAKPAITITIDPPPLVIPTLIVQTPSPTIPKMLCQPLGSPPPHRASIPNTSYFQFPSPKQSRKMLKDFDKPTSLDLPCVPPMITITCNMSEVESDNESISPAMKSSDANPSGMTYLSPFSMNPRGEHTASESNLSSSGYSSMASPGPSRCNSNNPLCPGEMDDQGSGGFQRRSALKSNTNNAVSLNLAGIAERRGRSDSETLSDDPLVESNDEGIGTDHIDEKIDDGELKSAKELQVFMVNEEPPPLIVSNKNSLQLPSIVVQCETSGCDKHLSPMSSRSESPLSDRTTGLGRFSPQFYGRHKDLLPFTDSDGLYDFPSSDKVNVTSCTHHKKPGRKREKKVLRNSKTPSPTKVTYTHLDVSNKDLYKVPPPRKLSPKRRITRSQVVSSSSSSDSIASTAREIKLSSSSPSPETTRWTTHVAWLEDKCSKSREFLSQDIQETESFPLAKSVDFSKTHYGNPQKFSKLRAIGHQIRFLRRLELSLKKRDRTLSPSDSFDSDEDSPRATSPLLQPTKSFKPEIRKSSSIGKLQGSSKDKRMGRRSRGDLQLSREQSPLKVVLTE